MVLQENLLNTDVVVICKNWRILSNFTLGENGPCLSDLLHSSR